MRCCWILALALAACGSHDADPCDRVVARLRRLDDAHHRKHADWMDGEARRQCRERGWDPVVSCAIAGPTDEAADACIERGVRATLGLDGGAPIAPGASGASGTSGKGLNPLLDE